MMNCLRGIAVFIYSLVTLSFQIDQVSTQNVQAVNITRSDNLNAGDEIELLAINSTQCQDQDDIGTELRAQCTLISQQNADSGQKLCYMECVCKNDTGSFILSQKQCSDERQLRQGCDFAFGSWSWSTGWVWNTENDRLFVLYLEDGFGIEGAFNASAEDFNQCTYTSLSSYDASGEWNVFTLASNESFITFFTMRGYWHVFWIIEDLTESGKAEIEGKFVKLDVTCENSKEENGIVKVTELSSCLVFKVTGNISHEYNITTTRTELYSSTTVVPATTTTAIHIQPTTEPIEPSVTTLEPTSSIAVLFTTNTPSQLTESSSVIESTSVVESSSDVKSSPVIISSPVTSLFIYSTSATYSSPVISSSPVVKRSSVNTNTPVIKSSSVIYNSPVITSSSVIYSSPVITSSSVTYSSPVPITSSPGTGMSISPVLLSMTQSTQAMTAKSNTTEPRNGSQIGLILGIVVAGGAAVVMSIGAIVLTLASLYNGHVKRMQIVQINDKYIQMEALESLDKILPAHV